MNGSRATRKLLSRLMKYPPTTWDEIHNAYCAEVRAGKDDLNGPTHRLTSVQAESRKDRRSDIRRDPVASRPNQERHLPYVRTTVVSSSRHEEGPPRSRTGTHRNEREIVYTLEKLGPKVKWPQKMRSDPNTRKSDALWTPQRIAERLGTHQGPLKPPSPARTIYMIIGGGDNASINNIKFTITHKLKRPITHKRYNELEESIIFDKSVTNGLAFPHYDALVITLQILDTDVRRIMVDDGSGTGIIHPRVLTQMKLKDKIVPCCIALIGFNNAVERTSGEITLPVLRVASLWRPHSTSWTRTRHTTS
uniref:Uncharacterized protein n=1 Tax=Nicotiana tabacum TaxID=4097 RepID=A0A1S4D6H2_TOBAC|nr:PREDICTED: uncharacterized protein LOC107826557 [Nicotiana tabacum]